MTRVLDESADVAFAITADSGELAIQANLLVESIRKQYPTAPILVFIPESSVSDLDEDVLEWFQSTGSVVTGAIPIPEYPISALIQAFVEVEQQYETEYIVALDTDTLLLDHLHLPDGGDTWLRPADVGAQYWTSEKSRGDWQTLYQYFNYPTPDPFYQFIASVDRQPIPPYWNSGVVITTDRTLPGRWLDFTETIFHDETLPVSTDEFFIDQISLALSVRKNDVQLLSERENFPLGGRLVIPPVAVMHYGNRQNLVRIFQPRSRMKLHQLGAIPDIVLSDICYSFLVVASTKAGMFLSHSQKEFVRGVFERILRDETG
jgi:hypothetical protein